MKRVNKMQLNVGDSVGGIYKKSKNGEDFWELVEDKINKITITKKYGRRSQKINCLSLKNLMEHHFY